MGEAGPYHSSKFSLEKLGKLTRSSPHPLKLTFEVEKRMTFWNGATVEMEVKRAGNEVQLRSGSAREEDIHGFISIFPEVKFLNRGAKNGNVLLSQLSSPNSQLLLVCVHEIHPTFILPQ